MCGITGILKFKKNFSQEDKAKKATDKLILRGPDDGATVALGNCILGHRRLSIIDVSGHAAQPMSDPSGRYTIVFNGEIFNYAELKKRFFPDKQDWISASDTEVLLHLFIRQKEQCLSLLSGFFAFAVWDAQHKELFIARDRYGKKPLLYYFSDAYFAFASEMKALLAYDIPKEIDYTVLLQYFQLNYIPQPQSILKGVAKLPQGHYMYVRNGNGSPAPYYELRADTNTQIGYVDAQKKLINLLDDAVRQRLISDVPLGAFLSGGVDSSVVVALASRHIGQLNTFSIGYKNNLFFDETRYARLVAEKYNTRHTVFSLTNDDFLEHLNNILDYIDEPFADSSAIPVYILSHYTRRHVTVALSGDGGDEVFGGYIKHEAERRARQRNIVNILVKAGSSLWKLLPQSRNNKTGNLFRQLNRFADGLQLDPKERYWRWASFINKRTALGLLHPGKRHLVSDQQYSLVRGNILKNITGGENLEDFLLADMNLVLVSDMLTKVDSMSMANSLEIRSPLLDHEVVDFAFSLPTKYKVDGKMKKKILQDAFRHLLPEEIYNRPKHGFEIPLLNWFRKELRPLITDDLLNEGFVADQGIFDPATIAQIKAKLFSANPGDAHATVWALIVFQSWWKKYFN